MSDEGNLPLRILIQQIDLAAAECALSEHEERIRDGIWCWNPETDAELGARYRARVAKLREELEELKELTDE